MVSKRSRVNEELWTQARASGTTAENTLEGYRESSGKPGTRGFRYWEFDIRESSDGIIFVFHDDAIDVGGKQSETSRMPFSEIKRAGSQRGISIPLFSEVCEELGDSAEMVMVEIKHLSSEGARDEVLEALRSRGNWKAMATPERFSRIPARYQGRLGCSVSVGRGGACPSVATG